MPSADATRSTRSLLGEPSSADLRLSISLYISRNGIRGDSTKTFSFRHFGHTFGVSLAFCSETTH